MVVAFADTLQLDLGAMKVGEINEIDEIDEREEIDEVVCVAGGVYPKGGAGCSYDDGYGSFAVRTGDWSAL